MDKKKCSHCGDDKFLDEFVKDKRKPDGFRDCCKTCRNTRERKNRDKNIDKSREYHREYLKKWRDINKEEKLAKERDKYQKNKDKINARKRITSKIHYKNNKEKYLIYKKNAEKRSKKRRKERFKQDPIYKLQTIIRSGIRNTLKRKGFKKNNRTEIILGCSIEFFKTYIETKFESWMNWDNHGKYNGELNFGWDLDHIIPASSAKTEQEVIALNHYTNFQPLCSKINRHIKGGLLPY